MSPTRSPSRSARYQTVGCDQVVFGLPSDSFEHDEVLEMLEVFGTKVIPAVRLRSGPLDRPATGRPRCASTTTFNFPVPDIKVEELPTNAMIQLDGTRKL